MGSTGIALDAALRPSCLFRLEDSCFECSSLALGRLCSTAILDFERAYSRVPEGDAGSALVTSFLLLS